MARRRIFFVVVVVCIGQISRADPFCIGALSARRRAVSESKARQTERTQFFQKALADLAQRHGERIGQIKVVSDNPKATLLSAVTVSAMGRETETLYRVYSDAADLQSDRATNRALFDAVNKSGRLDHDQFSFAVYRPLGGAIAEGKVAEVNVAAFPRDIKDLEPEAFDNAEAQRRFERYRQQSAFQLSRIFSTNIGNEGWTSNLAEGNLLSGSLNNVPFRIDNSSLLVTKRGQIIVLDARSLATKP